MWVFNTVDMTARKIQVTSMILQLVVMPLLWKQTLFSTCNLTSYTYIKTLHICVHVSCTYTYVSVDQGLLLQRVTKLDICVTRNIATV